MPRVHGSAGWRPAVAWAALAVAGQAAALRLVDAGHLVRYQHYGAPGRLVAEHPGALGLVLVQALAVALGLGGRWRPLRDWVTLHLKPWQALLVAAVFAVPSATVSADPRRYLAELVFAAFVQAVSLGNVVLAVLALGPAIREALGERIRRLITRGGPGIDRVVVLATAWVTVVAALLCLVVYENHPHIQDEVAYVLHAQTFAHGLLTRSAPPVPEAFDVFLMQLDGNRWYSCVAPGWPAVLAIGTLLGVPWLVNPVVGGLGVLLAFLLVRDLYDPETARLVVLLLAVSPWYVYLAMSFMTHTVTFACALAAAVAVIRARAGAGGTAALWGGLAGASLGLGVLVRPLDGVLAAALVGLWALGLGGRRLSLAALAALATGSVVFGGLTLPYNRALTGHANIFPVNAYFDRTFHPNANAYGFGPDRGMGWAIDPWPGHGPLDALVNANLNTFMLNVELLGWGAGSLLPIALLPFLRRPSRADLAMVCVMAAVFGVYFFFYFSGGPDFGARYWFLMLLPLAVLTARGLCALDAALPGSRPATSGGGASIAALTFAVMALVTFFPWRAIDKYHDYLGMAPGIRRLARDGRFGRDLVLVRGETSRDYPSAAVYNPIDLAGDGPVFARDRGSALRSRLLARYQDRRVWIVDGPSLTGRGFEIVRGPIPARELLADTEVATTAR